MIQTMMSACIVFSLGLGMVVGCLIVEQKWSWIKSLGIILLQVSLCGTLGILAKEYDKVHAPIEVEK